MSTPNFLKKALIVALAAAVGGVGLVLDGGDVARAASNYTIGGTVPSKGTWYLSATIRTVATSNTTITINLTTLSTNGLKWRLRNAKNDSVFTSVTTITNNASHTLATNVLANTKFKNEYEMVSICTSIFYIGCKFDFAGVERY